MPGSGESIARTLTPLETSVWMVPAAEVGSIAEIA